MYKQFEKFSHDLDWALGSLFEFLFSRSFFKAIGYGAAAGSLFFIVQILTTQGDVDEGGVSFMGLLIGANICLLVTSVAFFVLYHGHRIEVAEKVRCYKTLEQLRRDGYQRGACLMIDAGALGCAYEFIRNSVKLDKDGFLKALAKCIKENRFPLTAAAWRSEESFSIFWKLFDRVEVLDEAPRDHEASEITLLSHVLREASRFTLDSGDFNVSVQDLLWHVENCSGVVFRTALEGLLFGANLGRITESEAETISLSLNDVIEQKQNILSSSDFRLILRVSGRMTALLEDGAESRHSLRYEVLQSNHCHAVFSDSSVAFDEVVELSTFLLQYLPKIGQIEALMPQVVTWLQTQLELSKWSANSVSIDNKESVLLQAASAYITLPLLMAHALVRLGRDPLTVESFVEAKTDAGVVLNWSCVLPWILFFYSADELSGWLADEHGDRDLKLGVIKRAATVPLTLLTNEQSKVARVVLQYDTA